MPTLESVLNDYCRNLPKLTGEADYFPNFFFKHLEEYYQTIEKSSNFLGSLYKNENLVEREDTFLTQLKKIIDGITECLKLYLSGLPSTAFEELKNTISNTYLKTALQSSQIKHIKRDQSFYRVRVGDINEPILPLELFHLPFEKRKFVAAQRFSIPGYPCLYMGNSLNVAFKELDIFTDDALGNVKAARITNNCNILIVDIDPYQIPNKITNTVLGNKAKWANDVYQSGLMYPLIAACHCKITYSGVPKFKIEYIIPQLLLQWFKETKENKLIQGIRYLSNRINTGDNYEKMYNYVFPVIDCVKESGHCNNLKHLFKISDVVNTIDFPFNEVLFSKKVDELESHLNKLEMHIL